MHEKHTDLHVSLVFRYTATTGTPEREERVDFGDRESFEQALETRLMSATIAAALRAGPVVVLVEPRCAYDDLPAGASARVWGD